MVFTITIAGWTRINCAPSKAHQRHLTLRNWRKICARWWKGIVRGRSTIDKSMILLKMRCTLPHHSSSSKETGCCWTTRSGASLRNFVISRFYQRASCCVAGASGGRKLAGGVSLADAEAFYDRTDGPNVRRVLEESLPANLTLMMTATGEYRLVD